MKRFATFLAAALIAATGAGQITVSLNFSENRTSPVFRRSNTLVQGEQVQSLNDYLKISLQYPQELVRYCIQGTEVIEFTITSEGEPTGFKVLNSICPKIDNEIIDILKSTDGKWLPGTIDGKPADMKQEISVVFQLCSGKVFIKKAKQYIEKGNQMMYVKNKPQKALKYYNMAVTFLPYEENALSARSACLSLMGDTTSAKNDWKRIQQLAERNAPDYQLAVFP